jgi:hypothetical protein
MTEPATGIRASTIEFSTFTPTAAATLTVPSLVWASGVAVEPDVYAPLSLAMPSAKPRSPSSC